MQDRFKFRAYYKVDKKMHNVNAIIAQENCIELFEAGEEPSPDDFKGIITARKEMCVLMQCTGLKDKNGKLIFEGDILKLTKKWWTNEEYYYYSLIVWDRAQWQAGLLKYQRPKAQKNRRYDRKIPLKNFVSFQDYTPIKEFVNAEVIGNAYENPELLESEPTNE